jgi:acetyl esterase
VTDTRLATGTDDIDQAQIRIMPGAPPISIAEARTQSRLINAQRLADMNSALTPASETEQEIPSPNGSLRIRVLRPRSAAAGSPDFEAGATRPTIVYFHGGGWIIGDLDTHLGQARRLCALVNAVVVSVEYRCAPEHRFPAAFDDAVFSTQWVSERLADFGGNDVLIVAGDGSGGQLAASVAIARRDAGQPLSAQLLLYPVTDVSGRYLDPEINEHYMSRWSAHKRFGLTLEALVTMASLYVDAEDASDWRVSPKKAADLSGVAPAVIQTSTLDVLRTEGNFYADDLRAAGVDVIAREFPSLNHSYFGLGGVAAVADAAAAEGADDLRTVLARA